MPKNAAQYVRMSTDQQPLSIETQKVAIAVYARDHDMEIVRTYADEARSGLTLSRRDAMQQMLRDVMEADCPFTVILVLDVSRWGRFQDVDESAYHEYHCRKHGVRLIYVAEQFGNSDSPFHSLLKHFRRTMAAEDSRILGVKSRAGQLQTVNLGFASGLLPCIGYRRQAVSLTGEPKGILAPRERKPMLTDRVRWILGPLEEQLAVRTVFHQYAHEGLTKTEIVKRLGAAGVRSHDGRPIEIWMLDALLEADVVTGNYTWGTRSNRQMGVTNIERLSEPARNSVMVAPLVDAETWDLTQARLRENVRYRQFGLETGTLLHLLREALIRDPTLSCRTFGAQGLPRPRTYVKHFGSLTAAYRAVGRSTPTAEVKLEPPCAPSVRAGLRFLDDVVEMVRSSGLIAVNSDPTRRLIFLSGTSIYVRVARPIFSRRGRAQWNIQALQHEKAAQRWLLVLCLNVDRCTAHTFYLMPPAAHENFPGLFTKRRLVEFEQFRIESSMVLLERILRVTTATTADATGP